MASPELGKAADRKGLLVWEMRDGLCRVILNVQVGWLKRNLKSSFFLLMHSLHSSGQVSLLKNVSKMEAIIALPARQPELYVISKK